METKNHKGTPLGQGRRTNPENYKAALENHRAAAGIHKMPTGAYGASADKQRAAAEKQRTAAEKHRAAAEKRRAAAKKRREDEEQYRAILESYQAVLDGPPVPAKEQGTAGTDRRAVAGIIGTVAWRTFLSILTAALLTVFALVMVLALVFRGPSKTARNVLTMSLTEASATKWIPAIFLGKQLTEEIRTTVAAELPDDVSDISQVTIDKNSVVSANEEWKDYPDGIRIETVSGDTYNAYVMIIRDPSRVYLSVSSDHFSKSIPGERIDNQIEKEKAAAAINAGAFFDDGTTSQTVGSVPIGLVYSQGRCVWDDKQSYYGFVGLTEEHVLVVAKTMLPAEAEKLKIRDGCCFGPVLIMNGAVNETAYNSNSGYNPRTCIGQRADGAIIFVCVDGRQAGSLGATYSDIIDILVEKGAVNASNLDGGSSTVMLYRDVNGIYGEKGKVQMINQYSLLQQRPRRMPTFFMVKPVE